MKAAYLSADGLATTSPRLMLRDIFGAANLREVKADELTPANLRGIDLLWLPAITGETSPYYKLIDADRGATIRKSAEDNGLIIWTDCAATYYACNHAKFLDSGGRMRERAGLGWIDAEAKGPIEGQARPADIGFRFNDVTLAEIEFYTGPRNDLTQICYGNGPALYLSEAERHNPDVAVFGRFNQVAGKPVAAMTKVMGNGMLVSLSVLVQIKKSHLQGHWADPEQDRHRQYLFDNVSANEHRIQAFEDMVLARLHQHRQNAGNSGIPLLEHRYA